MDPPHPRFLKKGRGGQNFLTHSLKDAGLELSRPVIYVPVVAVAPIGTDWIEHKVKVCTIALDHVLLPLLLVLTDIAKRD